MAAIAYNTNTPPICTLLVSTLYNDCANNVSRQAKNGKSEAYKAQAHLPFDTININIDTSVEENTCVLTCTKKTSSPAVASPHQTVHPSTTPTDNKQQAASSNHKVNGINPNTDKKTSVCTPCPNENTLVSTDITIARQLAFSTNILLRLYGDIFSSAVNNSATHTQLNKNTYSANSAEIDYWVDISCAPFPSVSSYMSLLNNQLRLRTYVVGRLLTLADISLFARIIKDINVQTNKNLALFSVTSLPSFHKEWSKDFCHVARWYEYIKGSLSFLNRVGNAKGGGGETGGKEKQQKHHKDDKQTKKAAGGGGDDKSAATGGSYENKLPGAEMGKVVVRFPPEPSGYLHIGHAKAALLNAYFARLYQGKLIVRFDDTNPAKEKEEFENSIMEDLKLLNIQPDVVTHTSQYFDKLIEYGEKFIKDGNAYVDDTPGEKMREERLGCIESKCRNQTVEKNLEMWKEMIIGSEKGVTYCLRAKINMKDDNGCMRDPVLFRCIVDIPHHKLGFKYTAYPIYDFACPIVDSLEGVTHAMRSNEYSDRIPQYKWVLEKAGLRDVCIYEFSRLNFVKTVLSKRRLTWFVEQKLVEGWDDPRFPTVRGIIRRGLKAEALLKFLLEQGPSKNSNLMEWDKLWTINKQILDPCVKRYTAVDLESVALEIADGPKEMIKDEREFHAKNPSLGKTFFYKFNEVLIEKDDALLCAEGEEVGLMRWSCVIIDKIIIEEDEVEKGKKKVKKMIGHLNPNGDFKNVKKKLHWLPNYPQNLVRITLREYDHLLNVDKPDAMDINIDFTDFITKVSVFDSHAFGDYNVLELNVGDTIQLERRGYFRVDKKTENENEKMVLIKIPDGKSRSMSHISTKVDAAKFGGKTSKKDKNREKRVSS